MPSSSAFKLSCKRKRKISSRSNRNTRWAGRNWREDEVIAPPPVGGLEPSDCHLAVFLDDICEIEGVIALWK